jgi:hypothetical protein
MINSSIANFHLPVNHGTPRKVWRGDEHPCTLMHYGIFCCGLNLFIKEPPGIVTYGESGCTMFGIILAGQEPTYLFVGVAQ